jgi:SAM-dependent methyltransferase
MENAIKTLNTAIMSNDLLSITYSAPREKSQETRNIIAQGTNNESELKLELRLQKHNDIKSISREDFAEQTKENLSQFKQCFIKLNGKSIQILLNKKLKAKIIEKSFSSTESTSKSHNRSKNYLIPDGEKCDFLIEIGVMDKNGKVKSNYYKKFKQINRFLELVDDLFKDTEFKDQHIVDFGCGKSYLTFALYHYFTVIKKSNVQITGIDLKQEVIDHCNNIAQKLSYDNLKFTHGFIHDFKTDTPVDFVVTLHACDTATDDAILFSLRNNATKMMFVPCCQHELNKQLQNNESNIMLKHGIFKERLTSLVTDTMRSQLLESCGYKVQSMEFIDLEHTAKNILLRCQKVKRTQEQKTLAFEKYLTFKEEWSISPYLESEMLKENLLSTNK